MTSHLIETWTVGDITYKLIEIEREEIDEGSSEDNAHDLVGIYTATNVRRVDYRFDAAYGRPHLQPGDNERVDAAILRAPPAARDVMADYGWDRKRASRLLRNDFHRTATRVRVGYGQPLTANQIRRVRSALCGVAGCTCGGSLGERGPQEVEIVESGIDEICLEEKAWSAP